MKIGGRCTCFSFNPWIPKSISLLHSSSWYTFYCVLLTSQLILIRKSIKLRMPLFYLTACANVFDAYTDIYIDYCILTDTDIWSGFRNMSGLYRFCVWIMFDGKRIVHTLYEQGVKFLLASLDILLFNVHRLIEKFYWKWSFKYMDIASSH